MRCTLSTNASTCEIIHTMDKYTVELEVAKAIAHKAGSMMTDYFDGDQHAETKQDGTPVTIADRLINTMVIHELKEAFPDDVVIGEEESTGEYGRGRRWFCDPIDGTKGYTWGTPTAMFSLGLVVDGAPVVGVCYDPFLDNLYWAVKGNGAFCNGTQLHVSSEDLTTGTVAVSSAVKELRRDLPYLDNMIDQAVKMAVFSGAVYKMMLIARGKMVGFMGAKVSAYDMAASHVIVVEAGGVVTNQAGAPYDYTQPFRGTLVSNGIVHDALKLMLAS